jgi:hypothetical protein
VESMVPVGTVVPMTSVAAPCVAWRGQNEKKRNCQEGDCDYLSHTSATSLRYKRSPQAMRRQRFDLTANVCVGDNQLQPKNNGCRGLVPQRHHDEVPVRIRWRLPFKPPRTDRRWSGDADKRLVRRHRAVTSRQRPFTKGGPPGILTSRSVVGTRVSVGLCPGCYCRADNWPSNGYARLR